jgi:hypothetical protein
MSQIPGAMSNKPKKVFMYDVLPDGDYPARLVRFTGLGTQPQAAYKGTPKDPAFKASFSFELIDTMTSGEVIEGIGTDKEVRTVMEPKPACQFADYFLFPGAKRGHVFDLVNVLQPGTVKVPGNMDWFEGQLDAIVSISVGHYIIKKEGPTKGMKKNTIRGISAIPSMFKSQVGERRCDIAYFDPYEDTSKMFESYELLYKFQRDILSEAIDAQHIPFAGKEVVYQPPGQEQAAPTNTTETKQEKPDDVPDFDDDVPF